MNRGHPFVAFLVLLSLLLASPATSAPAVTVTIGVESVGVSRLALGVTHTQHSADANGDRAAVQSAQSLLAATAVFQNQHIMGWGAANPEPWPGAYDWRSLDARVDLMRETGGTPVLTLAGAPDWMKGGLPGITDWSRLEEAPLPRHYDDFARLAQRVALRYRDVRYFQVWNEMKGFWDRSRARWRYEQYTQLYNQVYDAVKAVRPDAQIGGPYVVLDSWSTAKAGSHPSAPRGAWGIADQRALDVVEYWLEYKRGAQFVAVDASTRTRDTGLVTDPFTASEKFADLTAWVRSRTQLPIVWSEWRPASDTTDSDRRVAVAANALLATAEAGANAVLLWQPQGTGTSCNVCLWTDTRRAGGGAAQPMYGVVRSFAAAFPPGTTFRAAVTSSTDVGILASDRYVALVNRTPETLAVSGVTGVTELHPYEVKFAQR